MRRPASRRFGSGVVWPSPRSPPRRGRQDRLRHLRRPRGPLDRAGRDERSHRGHRRGRGRPAHDLRRRGGRRRLEVGGRRPRLQADLRQAQPVDRRDHDRPARTRRPSGWAPARPGRATASRSATASTRRPTAARTGSGWASRRPSASRRSSSTRRTRTPCSCAPPATSWTRTPSAASTARTDGGKTWEKMLFVDDDTGCADLAIDPQDPSIVYAAMWQFRRKPYFFTLGRARAAASTSRTDGGKTWSRLTKGLPEGELGRIAVAVAPARAERRLRDGRGEEERRSTAPTTSARAGTETQHLERRHGPAVLLRAPRRRPEATRTASTSPERRSAVSDDGGKTFSSVGGGGLRPDYHGDVHALWINPHEHRRS